MQTITVNASLCYDIYVGRGLLSGCGDTIRSVTKAKKAAIVTDDIVAGLYLDKVVNSLKNSGFEIVTFSFPNGEASKCSRILMEVYDFLVDSEITRSDVIIALGGGVVGELTGFASASYLRGVDFVQIPTTLLAQVDSSVGGKTAIDLPSGKNLVGAFKQPKCVICDIDVLSTLSNEFFADGMGEVIKYGMIKSASLFQKLSNENIHDCLEDVIAECISIKRDVVEADEFDKGDRMLLNFGHTLGHAIEKYFNFTGISHGKAIGVGMSVFTGLAEQKNLCKAGTLDRLNACLKKYALPISVEPSIGELAKFCLSDKKRESDFINIVLCKDIGESYFTKISIADFYKFLNI